MNLGIDIYNKGNWMCYCFLVPSACKETFQQAQNVDSMWLTCGHNCGMSLPHCSHISAMGDMLAIIKAHYIDVLILEFITGFHF